MAIRRTMRPAPPVYDDSAWRKRLAQFRKEHPKLEKVFRFWEAAGCDIELLAGVASVWVIQSVSGYRPTQKNAQRLRKEFDGLLRKVEGSCAALARFLSKTYGQQAAQEASRYLRESERAADLRGRLRDAFNTDSYGRGADLRPLVAVQEEIRRHTGKRPGEAQFRVLLELTAHACQVEYFQYDSESLRKSLDHFRKNPLNKEDLQTFASTPLRIIVNEFASQGNK